MTRGYVIWLSAVLVAASATAAVAADQPIYTKAPPSAPAAIEYGNLYFGVDWNSHHSLAGYAGVLYAPMGMHQSGLRLAGFGLRGRYRYDGGDNELFKANFVAADALVGWATVFSKGAFTFSVGANHQNHRVRPFDPDNPVQGSKTGFKAQADLWVHPTPETLLFAIGSFSTAFDTYYALGRLGYDFTGSRVFFGPEVGGLGNDRTDQFRVGAHLTGIKLGPAKLTVSGGWFHERGEGDGGYATANLDFPF
jgi:hypothetical protein